jgi:hypothetical protein
MLFLIMAKRKVVSLSDEERKKLVKEVSSQITRDYVIGTILGRLLAGIAIIVVILLMIIFIP